MKDLFGSDFILQRNRYPWIDYARGISIILVVYRHSYEGLKNANLMTDDYLLFNLVVVSLFSFRMPLFFLVSGIFLTTTLKRKTFGDYVIDKLKILIYPLLLWGSIQISLQLLMADHVNAERKPFDYLNLILQPRKIEQFWYLNTLFMVGVVYAFFKSVLKLKYWQLMVSAIVFYLTAHFFYVLHAKPHGATVEFLAYSFIPDFLHFYIYFFIGDVISSFAMKKENQLYLSSLKVLIPLLIVYLVGHFYFGKINFSHRDETYVEHFMPGLFLFVTITGCAMMIQVSFILQRFNILKFLRTVGYHSLYIYVSHLIIVSGMRVLFTQVFHIYHIPTIILVSLVAGVTIPILMYNVLMRNGMWWLFTLKKPKEEIKHYHSGFAMSN